jgi:hypothetical protein
LAAFLAFYEPVKRCSGHAMAADPIDLRSVSEPPGRMSSNPAPVVVSSLDWIDRPKTVEDSLDTGQYPHPRRERCRCDVALLSRVARSPLAAHAMCPAPRELAA